MKKWIAVAVAALGVAAALRRRSGKASTEVWKKATSTS